MSMKSSGASSCSCSGRLSRGMASTGDTSVALSTSAMTSTRAPSAPRSAGRCDCRAMPPAPMTAPRYRFRSGDAGVAIALGVEQAAQCRSVPLVDPQQRHEQQAHPHRLDPQERRDVRGDRRHTQQHKPDVLPEPGAQREHDLLTRAVFRTEPFTHAAAAQQTDELGRAREKLRLPHDIVAVYARAEALEAAPRPRDIHVFREIQLALVTDADVEKRVAHEVYGGRLVGMRQSRRHPQEKRPWPPEPRVNEPVDEVKVEIDESEAVAGAVEYAADACGRTAQPRELPVRRVEDVRDDEQHKPDDVGPAVPIREQVTGHEPDGERPQRDLVR